MILDAIFLLFLVLFLIRGYKKGLVIALFAVFSLVVGLLCALKFSGVISGLLFDKQGSGALWAVFFSYIIVFTLTVWLVRLGAKAIDKAMSVVLLGWLNRLSGALLYGFLATLIFSTFLWMTDKMGLIGQETRSSSRCYGLLAGFAPGVFNAIGLLLPFIKSAFQDLSAFFDRVKAGV